MIETEKFGSLLRDDVRLRSEVMLSENDWITLNQLMSTCGQLTKDYAQSIKDYKKLSTAVRFLLALPTNIPHPEFYIDVDGDPSFEWYEGLCQTLSVSLASDNKLSYAALIGEEKICGTEVFDQGLPDGISDSLKKLY